MPVYLLGSEPRFPPPALADGSGLLAVGGGLSPEWLLSAYVHGVFPWFNSDEEIMWWSPDPRLVLYPSSIKISKSLRQTLRSQKFELRVNSDFASVISQCAKTPRPGQGGTWITPEMRRAYMLMHELGWAHSFESWFEGKLVGGLYGLAIGDVFFGESMFSRASDASKVALVHLCDAAQKAGIKFIDCQSTTAHLMRMGAVNIERKEFLQQLSQVLQGGKGQWRPTR
jgi:leucyl/phenylalanyl-tRNA--protein transferase